MSFLPFCSEKRFVLISGYTYRTSLFCFRKLIYTLYWQHNQARRQDLAAGGPKNRRRGQKPEGWPRFQNTVLIVCSNQGAKREIGDTDFISKGGPSTTAPPPADDGPEHNIAQIRKKGLK